MTLKEYRKQAGISMETFREVLGNTISLSMLYYIERGKRGITKAQADKLAKFGIEQRISRLRRGRPRLDRS